MSNAPPQPTAGRRYAVVAAAVAVSIFVIWWWFSALGEPDRQDDHQPVQQASQQSPTPVVEDFVTDEEKAPRPPTEQITGGEDTPSGIGPRRWMAEPDDIDVDDVERQLRNGEMKQEYELARRRDRRASIDAVRPLIADCHRRWKKRRPDGGERIAVQWKMSTRAGVGTVEQPKLLHVLGAQDQSIHDCVHRALDGLTFDAVGDGAQMTVRWIYTPPTD